MTEAEWLECERPEVIWRHSHRVSAARKMTLAGVAVCRHALAVRNESEQFSFELSVAEACADGHLEPGVLERVHGRLVAAMQDAPFFYPTFNDPPDQTRLVSSAITAVTQPGYPSAVAMELVVRAVASPLGNATVLSQFISVLRDIFGNPFRPVTFAPEWQTSTAVAIAKGMYESRDFGPMPILADALQDAGCDNEEVLRHCRDESQSHVRGCWVVDLVLGKA